MVENSYEVFDDELLEDNENEDNEYGINIPKEKRKLNTLNYDYSIDFLNSYIQKKKIILEVPFQRNQVWNRKRCSALIESIIMNVPIPPLYFSEEENNSWLVLDGLQRLISISDYYNNKYKLTGLEVLTDLNGKKYSELPQDYQSLLDDGIFRINLLKKDSHRDIKYDIFMRLNRGSVVLNYQELRNCLYRGKFNDLLKRLRTNEIFLSLLNLKAVHRRFLDIEFILRYLAITNNIIISDDGNISIDNYRGKLVQFLNEFMEKYKNTSNNQLVMFEKQFNETITKVNFIFGTELAFRNPHKDKSKLQKGIADFILPCFERLSMDYLSTHKQEILKKYSDFLSRQEIIKSLEKSTSSIENLNLRITLWFKEFHDELSL